MARQTKKLFNTTQDDIDKINPDNLELIEEFLDFYEATDHTEKAKTKISVKLKRKTF